MVSEYKTLRLIGLLTLGVFGFFSHPAMAQMWLTQPVPDFYYDSLLQPGVMRGPSNTHTTCAARQGWQVDQVWDASGNGVYKRSLCNGTAVGEMVVDVHLVHFKVEGKFLQQEGFGIVRGQFTGGVPTGQWAFSGPDCGRTRNVMIDFTPDGTGAWAVPAFSTVCGGGGFLEFGQLVKGVKDGYWAKFTELVTTTPPSYSLLPLEKGVFANGLRQGAWFIYTNYMTMGALNNVVTFKDDVPNGWFLSSYFVPQGNSPNYATTFSVTGTLQGAIPANGLTIPTSVEGVHFSGDWEFRINGAYTGGGHIVNGSGHIHYVDPHGNVIDGDISGGMPNGVWTVDTVAESDRVVQYTMQDGKVVSSQAIVIPTSGTTSIGPMPPVVSAPPNPTHPIPAPPASHPTTCSISPHLAACASALVAPFHNPGCSVTCQDPNHPAYCVPDSCSGDSYIREQCVCRK